MTILAVYHSFKNNPKNFSRTSCLKFNMGLLDSYLLLSRFLGTVHQGLPERNKNKNFLIETNYLNDKYCHNKLVKECVFGADLKTSPKVILFGDSHAGSLSPFWDKIGSKFNFNIREVSVDTCYPLLDTYNQLPSSEKNLFSPDLCHQQVQNISKDFNNYEVFILVGAWSPYLRNQEVSTGKFNFNFINELKNTLIFLQRHNKKVISTHAKINQH